VYLEFYGLKTAPFDITPNPRFLFHSAKHREAFNHLLYGIRERKGFVQLTGEVGAGKTTLCRALLEQLDGHYSTALILNPVLNADELMRAIATEFGLNAKGLDRMETMAAISDFLLKQMLAGKDSTVVSEFAGQRIVREPVPIAKEEPLKLELESFIRCVQQQRTPVVSGEAGKRALDVACEITRQIEEASSGRFLTTGVIAPGGSTA